MRICVYVYVHVCVCTYIHINLINLFNFSIGETILDGDKDEHLEKCFPDLNAVSFTFHGDLP